MNIVVEKISSFGAELRTGHETGHQKLVSCPVLSGNRT